MTADVLLSIVPDADAVADVVTGPHGTLTTMRPGTVHIEMSTVDVGRKQTVRDAVAQAGGDVKAALALIPITKPLYDRYRQMVAADYPHLEL